MAEQTQPQLVLPVSIATKADLVNVLRNLEDVLDTYVENTVRGQEGVDFSARADVSSNLAQLVKDNDLQVSIETLKALKVWLAHLKDKAPIVRFTFASDPTAEFLASIVDWLRKQSGQFVLVRYGIQPNIAAGCIMYTPLHRYDFTLRKAISSSGPALIEAIRKTESAPAETTVAVEVKS